MKLLHKTRKGFLTILTAMASFCLALGVILAIPFQAKKTVNAESSFKEVSLDFSSSDDLANWKKTDGGTTVGSIKDGKLYFNGWARAYLNIPFNTQETKYIAFDFYVPSKDTIGTTYSQIWMSLITDTTNANINSAEKSLGLQMQDKIGKIYVYKDAQSQGTYLGQINKLFFDKEHRMEIIIQGGYIKYYIDGTYYKLVENKSIPVPYTETTDATTGETTRSYDTYLFFESSHAHSYIDNLVIENTLDRRYNITASDKNFDNYDVKTLANDKTSGKSGWETDYTVDGVKSSTMLTRSGQYAVGYNWWGAEYYSFEVVNNTEKYVAFAVDITEGKKGTYGRWWTFSYASPYYFQGEDFVMKEGISASQGQEDYPNHGYVILPAGFNGRVWLPIENFEVLNWSSNNPNISGGTQDANALNLSHITWSDVYYYPVDTSATGTVRIANEKIYGSYIEGVDNSIGRVVKAINDIGAVTSASESQIAYARKWYDALSEDNKTNVSNYSVLQEAEDAFYNLPDYSYVVGADGKDFTGTGGVSFGEIFASAPSTVSAWIRVDRNTPDTTHVGTVIGNMERVGSKLVDGSNTFSFEITTNGNPKFEWKVSNAKKLTYTVYNADVRTGNWMHVAFVRELDGTQGSVTCYINGTAVGSISTSAQNIANINFIKPVMIGSDYTDDPILAYEFNPDFNGRIAGAHVYASTLTEEQVYNDMLGERASGLLGAIDFASGEVSSYYDHVNGDATDTYGWKDADISDFTAQDGEFSFAVIPDTQMLFSRAGNDSNGNSVYDENYNVNDNIFAKNVQWLIDNQSALNLQHVFHVGDLTDNLNYDAKWQNQGVKETKLGFEIMGKLSNAGISWSLARGNHDGGAGTANLAEWDKQWMASKAYTDAFEKGQVCTVDSVFAQYSYYQLFTVNEIDYLFLTLDVEPDNATLEWAKTVVESYPNRRVIISTHAYLGARGALMTSNMFSGHTNGKKIWDELASQYANVELVLCGHSSGPDIARTQLTGVNGNKVWNVMVDMSSYEFTGHQQPGLMSLVKFSADGRTVSFNLYSTTMGKMFRSHNNFTINLGEVEEMEEETEESDTPTLTEDNRQIVLFPTVKPFNTLTSGMQTTSAYAGDALQVVGGGGTQFRSRWLAYVATIDITKDGIFKFDTGSYLRGDDLYIAIVQTCAKDGLSRIVPLIDPDDTDGLIYANGIYGNKTQSSGDARFNVYFKDILPNGVNVSEGDKLSIIYSANLSWGTTKIDGAIYNEAGEEIVDYYLGVGTGSTANSTAIKGLYNVGYNGVLADGTASATKNYNGFTMGWVHLVGGFNTYFSQYVNTVTVKDESGNVLFTALSSGMGAYAGAQGKLPTLKVNGYIFDGYKVGDKVYAGDTYSVSKATSASGTSQTVVALFTKIPPYIYDIDGEIAWEYPSDSWAGELPELSRTGRIFLGYLIDGELYKAGTYFDNTKGQEIKAVFAKFGTLNGASLRLDEPTGLRYQTYLNASVYTALEGKLAFGTLIGRASDITVDGVMDYNLLTVGASYTHLDIVSNSQHEIGDYYYFKGAIVNIRESNYDLSLVGRGYMIVTYADGSTELYYAGVTDNARTVAYVAEKATEDISLVANKWYQYKVDGGYSAYDENDITLLGKWLA